MITLDPPELHEAALVSVEDGIAVYSSAAIVAWFAAQEGWSELEALEWFDFNIARAYLGPGSPEYV